jgi:hypothetical protein
MMDEFDAMLAGKHVGNDADVTLPPTDAPV